MPPVPERAAGPAGGGQHVVGELVDPLEEHRGLVLARIVVVEPLDVGEQHDEVRVHHHADERGQRVVVAEADLLDRGGVVLVDDRHDPHLEQALERAAREDVRLTVPRVVAREQDLRDRHAVRAHDLVVRADETDLPDRGRRLQPGELGRAPGQAQGLHAGRYRAGAHDDDVVARGPQGSGLTREVGEPRAVDAPVRPREGGGADLHDDPLASAHGRLPVSGRLRVPW